VAVVASGLLKKKERERERERRDTTTSTREDDDSDPHLILEASTTALAVDPSSLPPVTASAPHP